MNISNISNIISNQHDQFKTELIDWIVSQDFTHGLSLSHHRSVSLDRATHDLKRLHRDIDRKLLGCRYNASPDRTYGLFIFEGHADIETLHIHSLLKVAPRNHAKFERLFADDLPPEQGLWKRITPSGTHKLIANDNPYAAAIYLTKFIHMNTAAERIVFSHDFISASATIAA
jgi:hypothetical protein